MPARLSRAPWPLETQAPPRPGAARRLRDANAPTEGASASIALVWWARASTRAAAPPGAPPCRPTPPLCGATIARGVCEAPRCRGVAHFASVRFAEKKAAACALSPSPRHASCALRGGLGPQNRCHQGAQEQGRRDGRPATEPHIFFLPPRRARPRAAPRARRRCCPLRDAGSALCLAGRAGVARRGARRCSARRLTISPLSAPHLFRIEERGRWRRLRGQF